MSKLKTRILVMIAVMLVVSVVIVSSVTAMPCRNNPLPAPHGWWYLTEISNDRVCVIAGAGCTASTVCAHLGFCGGLGMGVAVAICAGAGVPCLVGGWINDGRCQGRFVWDIYLTHWWNPLPSFALPRCACR